MVLTWTKKSAARQNNSFNYLTRFYQCKICSLERPQHKFQQLVTLSSAMSLDKSPGRMESSHVAMSMKLSNKLCRKKKELDN